MPWTTCLYLMKSPLCWEPVFPPPTGLMIHRLKCTQQRGDGQMTMSDKGKAKKSAPEARRVRATEGQAPPTPDEILWDAAAMDITTSWRLTLCTLTQVCERTGARKTSPAHEWKEVFSLKWELDLKSSPASLDWTQEMSAGPDTERIERLIALSLILILWCRSLFSYLLSRPNRRLQACHPPVVLALTAVKKDLVLMLYRSKQHGGQVSPHGGAIDSASSSGIHKFKKRM